MDNDFSDTSVVVTGATSGIGLATVKALVHAGAFVIGVGRLEVRNQNAYVRVSAGTPKGKAVFLLSDLAVQDQIISLGKAIHRVLNANGFSRLDVLINNAGIYLEKKQVTVDDIEKTFAVNHLSAFLLTHEVMGMLQQADPGKVITVSSYSHRSTPLNLRRIIDPKPYLGLLAYKRSKLCNILFTHALNSREDRIIAFAVDPGLVNTAIASKGSNGLSDLVWRIRRKKGTPPEVPARTILYLAGEDQIDLSKGIYYKNCKLISASRKAHRKDLANQLWDLSCELTGIDW
ncbi:MAG: SDR family NAD(P)-dependent oxidoreductase [Brevefilum sp.]